MKTTKNSGNESSRRSNPGTNDRMKDVERKDRTGVENNWREQERKEEEWDAYGHGRENNSGKKSGMTVENKTKHEGESKSIHVEDWENDPFEYRSDEDDVKSEFDIRKGKNKKVIAGEEGESHEWQNDSGSTKYNGGNEYRKSGTDETLGVP
jgi:hypothetical protein